MIYRTLALLIVLIAVSVGLTYAIGEKVLVALGIVLVQLQILTKKLFTIEWAAIVLWLKTNTTLFLRVELLKKWATTSVLPLFMGSVLRRRVSAWLGMLQFSIRSRYDALLAWYDKLNALEKALTALVLIAALFALSVSSLGLWLVLFSIKMPLWIVAFFAAVAKSFWQSASKMLFRAVAFFQIGILWGLTRRILPESVLEKKRRFDFRIARAVVKRRRLTLRELSSRKETFALKWAVFREGLRQSFRRSADD